MVATELVNLHPMSNLNVGMSVRLSDFQGFEVDESVQLVHMDFKPQPGFDTILEVLERWEPSSVALRQDGRKDVTYGMILNFINTTGDLRQYGVSAKEVVAYICPPGAIGAMVFLTCIAQTCAAPIDRRAKMGEIEDMLKQLHVRHFLLFDDILFEDEISQLNVICAEMEINIVHITMDDATAGLYKRTYEDNSRVQKTSKLLRTSGEDTVCLLRTSGTTSKPKAVPLHQSGIIQNGLCLAEVIGINETDINLNVMPLFHIGGLSCCVLASLCKGGSLICMDSFSLEEFFRILARPNDPPTWYHAVPTVHTSIVQHCNGKAPPNHIRLVRSGAASLKPDIAKALHELFDCPVHPTYSMSEQMPIVQTPKGYDLSKPGSVGVPNCVSLMIASPTLLPLPFGHEGEVCISGPTVVSSLLTILL